MIGRSKIEDMVRDVVRLVDILTVPAYDWTVKDRAHDERCCPIDRHINCPRI